MLQICVWYPGIEYGYHFEILLLTTNKSGEIKVLLGVTWVTSVYQLHSIDWYLYHITQG